MLATALTAAVLSLNVNGTDSPTWMSKDSQPSATELQLKDATRNPTQQNIPTALPSTSAIPVTINPHERHNFATADFRRHNSLTREEIRQARSSKASHRKIRRLFGSFVATLRWQQKPQRHPQRQRVFRGLGLLATVMVFLMAAVYLHACFGPFGLPSNTRDGSRTLDEGLSKRRHMSLNPRCPVPSYNEDEDDAPRERSESDTDVEAEGRRHDGTNPVTKWVDLLGIKFKALNVRDADDGFRGQRGGYSDASVSDDGEDDSEGMGEGAGASWWRRPRSSPGLAHTPGRGQHLHQPARFRAPRLFSSFFRRRASKKIPKPAAAATCPHCAMILLYLCIPLLVHVLLQPYLT